MDPLRTLFSDLHSPDPSIRFSVLSRVEDIEWNEEQIAFLKGLAVQEKDPGTRFHMQKILARIQREKGGSQPQSQPQSQPRFQPQSQPRFQPQSPLQSKAQAQPPSQSSTAKDIEGLLKNPNRDDLSLALLLDSVHGSEAQLVAISLRETTWTDFHPEVLPSILRFLKKHGSYEDIRTIENLCRHPDPRVLAAAVEALEKLSPERLKDLIVPLLVNPSHGIRSRAVRLLHRWDPQEALRHFEAMLFSDDANDRQAALFHAFFFPFPDIEPLMLKFLGIETDPGMIEKVGFLFRANPAPDEPLRLLEAREASLGEKKRLIGEILAGVANSLFQAGLVKKRPDDLMAELEGIFFRRKAFQLMESCQLSLNSTEVSERKEAALRLCELVQRGFRDAAPIVKDFLVSEADPFVKSVIQGRFLDIQSPQKTEDYDLTKLSVEKRSRALAALDKNLIKLVRPCLPTFVKSCSSEEKILLMRALGRIGDKADAAIVQAFLNDSDQSVLIAAIEALRDLNPDNLATYLPRLIQHPADEVRAAAVRAFSLFDKKQAISLVEKMLFSLQPKQRGLAIFSAGQFDFPSVRDILLRAIEKEQLPENALQICAILKANLDEELAFSVFDSVQSAPDAARDSIEAFLSEALQILIKEGRTKFRNSDSFRQEAQKRLDAERQRQKSTQPSYSLKNIQKMRQQQAAAAAPKIDPSLVTFIVAAFSIGAVLTVLIWFLFLAPAAPVAGPPMGQTATKDPNVGQNVTRNLEGIIISVDDAAKTVQVRVAGEKNEIFQIECKESGIPLPVMGSRFRGQIRPKTKKGNLILADLLAVY